MADIQASGMGQPLQANGGFSSGDPAAPQKQSPIESFLDRFRPKADVNHGVSPQSDSQAVSADASNFAANLNGIGEEKSSADVAPPIGEPSIFPEPNPAVQDTPAIPLQAVPQEVPAPPAVGLDSKAAEGFPAGGQQEPTIDTNASFVTPKPELSPISPISPVAENLPVAPEGLPTSPKDGAVIAALTHAKETLEGTVGILTGAIDDLKGAEDNIGAVLGENTSAPVTPKDAIGSGV